MTPLPPHPHLRKPRGPVVLCILDGVGIGRGEEDDAVATAHTPTLDRLRAEHPHTRLQAHGRAVGMPSDEDMGNSEVGHNAMGCGRVFDQGAALVDRAIASGELFRSETWRWLVEAGSQGRTLHLLGLLSDGNVHSNVSHLDALLEGAARDGVERLRVHVLTDGRDVEGRSALRWLRPLEEKLAARSAEGRDWRIATGGGRMAVTMDRYEADWPMVARGWATHVRGEGRRFASAAAAVETLYAEDPKVDDQWLPAFVVGEPEPIADGDAVLFFNFRGDRAIEITRAFEEGDGFPGFDRGRRPEVRYAGMMQYDGDLQLPKRFLVAPPAIDRTLAEYLAAGGFKTFACSETQKFGHVTYFFNGNRSGRPPGEDWCEVPSDGRPFQERPWMKAAEITDSVVEAIATGTYDHVRLNFANGDMVGHTGDLRAARLAVEAVDLCVARVWEATRAAGGVLIVTADHGNADEMWMRDRKSGQVSRNPDGSPLVRPSHTLAPVPFVLCDPEGTRKIPEVTAPGLANVTGTVLALLGVAPPADYAPALVS